MTYFVYLIGSTNNNKLITYVGYTKNLNERLNLHNRGKGAKFTRGRRWRILYKEKYKTISEAKSREYYMKKDRKFRNKIKEIYK
tara:strand:- start:536 stop:787 length:252 start_codon:yes stop_codon:yes gene_type:complete